MDVSWEPKFLLLLSLPRWRAHAVGIRSTPTTTRISQSGPIDRDSGREKRNPPTASRASIAGHRGSKCFEVFGIGLDSATPICKTAVQHRSSEDCRMMRSYSGRRVDSKLAYCRDASSRQG